MNTEKQIKIVDSLRHYLSNGFIFLIQVHLSDGQEVGFIPLDGKLFVKKIEKLNTKPKAHCLECIRVDKEAKQIKIYSL